mgnify:FL=1
MAYSISNQVAFQKKKRNKDILITILFYLTTLLLPSLAIGKISFSEDNPIHIFQGITFKPEESPTIPVFILTVLIRSLLLFFLFHLRKNTKRMSKLGLSLFCLFLVYRLVSLFYFPYGKLDFVVHPQNGASDVTLLFPGLSIYDRISEFVYESLFALYFLFAFNYAKELPSLADKFLLVILKAFIALGVWTRLYSIAFERSQVIESIKRIIHADFSFFCSVSSFTSNKNVAGFFVLVCSFSCLLLFSRRPSYIYRIIYFLTIPYTVILQSRTPLILLLICGFLFGLLYPFFNFKKNKGYSVAFIIITALVLIVLISTYIIKADQINKRIHAFFEKGTIGSRFALISTSFDLFYHREIYLLTGLGKRPFAYLIGAYRSAIALNDAVYHTSHNAFLDILFTQGVLSLILALALSVYLLVLCFKIGKQNKWMSFTRILIYLSCLVYSFMEPRGLFLREGNIVFFIFLNLLPIFFLSNQTNRNKKILTEGL